MSFCAGIPFVHWAVRNIANLQPEAKKTGELESPLVNALNINSIEVN
ncbi:MAG: hypothetical protein K0S23_3679 [Fluviicola sp.]|jgi:hypothetical protein|nr:hypothetical protein [Fluviicola sp.]